MVNRGRAVWALALGLGVVLACAVSGGSAVGGVAPGKKAVAGPAKGESAKGKAPYNVIFIICDQESQHLFARGGFSLPARETLAKRGVTFKNHYISTAVCTPSRALFFTGTPPQVNKVFDQMSFRYVPNLDPKIPTMGSVLKDSGYKTAFFGKFECNLDILSAKKTDSTIAALQPYGFDVYNPDGDNRGGPLDGFTGDTYAAGASVRWLRENARSLDKERQPFFMVASFVNPHDIMFFDANVPGKPPVQKPLAPGLLSPPPPSATYEGKWDFDLPPSLTESLKAPGMPAALGEYDRGWSRFFGDIPTDRHDMWHAYYNYYLNCLRDSDRSIQQIVDAMNDLDLWKDTVVIFSADHGEMAGAHGGLRGKGPMVYDANVHVPLIIAHPDAKPGTSCAALTSHLDLLPTFFGLTGLAESNPDISPF